MVLGVKNLRLFLSFLNFCQNSHRQERLLILICHIYDIHFHAPLVKYPR